MRAAVSICKSLKGEIRQARHATDEDETEREDDLDTVIVILGKDMARDDIHRRES